MSELTLQEAALAWAQGKMVEAIHKTLFSERWTKVEPAGTECSNTYSAGVFGDCAGKYRFRLAPEPPAKKWRPYTREDLRGMRVLGETVIRKDRSFSALITVVLEEAVGIGVSHYTFQDLLNGFTWLDGSPCGVEVEA